MTKQIKTAKEPKASKRRITIERTYKAPIEDVWELWTTKEGIESWWGPDGFSVKVHSIDLRPGGELRYAMTATAQPQIEFHEEGGDASDDGSSSQVHRGRPSETAGVHAPRGLHPRC